MSPNTTVKFSARRIDYYHAHGILSYSRHKFIEITFRHGFSPVNLLHIFRIPFPKNTSVWLLLQREAFEQKWANPTA